MSFRSLLGKTIAAAYVNKSKTILVFVTSLNEQFEIQNSGERVYKITGLNQLIGNVISLICYSRVNELVIFLDMPDQRENSFYLTFRYNRYTYEKMKPTISPAHGMYLLSTESNQIKNLLILPKKDPVKLLTDDFKLKFTPNKHLTKGLDGSTTCGAVPKKTNISKRTTTKISNVTCPRCLFYLNSQ